MKYIFFGLGNIGADYEQTRHNIGFDVLDYLAQKHSGSFTSDRLANVASIKWKGRTLILVKPTTYMNLSGKAVQYWLQKEKLTPAQCMVITDDLSLPLGKMRIRAKGSDGGHNGLKNIQLLLQSEAYPRLRFGIGNDFAKGQQVDFVLGKWKADEQALLQASILRAAAALLDFTTLGLERTMNLYNTGAAQIPSE